MVASAAAEFAEREAVVDGGARLTFGDLAHASQRFAASLVASGVEPGQRVALWAFNSLEWVVAALGAWEAGAVVVPINTRFKGREAADIISRTRACALVTVTDFLDIDYVKLLAAAQAQLPDLHTTVVLRGPRAQGTVSWEAFLARAADGELAEVERRSSRLGAEDPSDILFTSGTTGSPKGVVQTHGRTLQVATDWVAMTGLCPSDRYLMVNPYFHMFGLKAGVLACLVAGATMLPQAVFEVEHVLQQVEAERVTVLPGPPTLYQSILDHPGRAQHDLSTLRVAVTGAADIPVELIRRVRQELPFSLVVTGYGLTEAGTATATSPNDDAETVATTVGRVRPGFEVRVADNAGQDVAPGQPGEVLLRGGSVMAHYLDDPVATAEAFTGDRWLRTGDLGFVDEAGCLHIVGRSKDMFIVGGFNVYPAEVENYLLEHEAVAQVAVIGVADERMGEVGSAFVVLRPGADVDPAALRTWARDRMANYKVPRAFQIVDTLPMTATGKVHKDALRQQMANQPKATSN